ncbi:hypothetical protein [Microbacterium sp.]|uniref:hypothetical protein n=1 Tax=Microbacterium sp. TaxID=51671 RepID=UPI0025D653D9|nr:hypothetical protein [Microbacterium sp.]
MPHNEETLAEHSRDSAAKTDERTADEVAEQVLAAGLGWVQTMAIYLGDRLGWYRSLAAEGPASPPSSRTARARPSDTRASGSSSRRRAGCCRPSSTIRPSRTDTHSRRPRPRR